MTTASPPIRFGLFLSQANKPLARGLRRVPDGRGSRIRPRLAGRPPRRHRRAAETILPRGLDAAGRDRRSDATDPPRRPRHEQYLPAPGGSAEGGGDRRPHQRRSADPRTRVRLARGRAPPVRDRPAGTGRTHRPICGGGRADQPPDEPAEDDLPRAALPAGRRPARAAAGPAAAHPGPHRGSPAAHDPPRCPLRGPVGHVRGDAGNGDRRRQRGHRGADRALDEACRAIGRDPAEIRRSTWATAAAVNQNVLRRFVIRHRRLGFTDFSTVMPAPGDEKILRTVASEVIPEIRAAWSDAPAGIDPRSA